MEEEKWVLAGPPLVCLDKRTPAAASILLPLLYLNILIMSSSERDTVKTLYSDILYNSKILYNVIVFAQMYHFSLNLNSFQQKFSLTSNYLGTNSVVVKRVDCIR